MSKLRYLKEYSEIVPGMIFEDAYKGKLYILNVNFAEDGRRILRFSTSHDIDEFSQSVENFTTYRYELIHDPRVDSIEKKIEEYKKQINILEKELYQGKLKDLFCVDKIYVIKHFEYDTPYLCKYKSECDKEKIIVSLLNNKDKIVFYNDIETIWAVNDLNDLFSDNPPIFERY